MKFNTIFSNRKINNTFDGIIGLAILLVFNVYILSNFSSGKVHYFLEKPYF